MEHEIVAAFKKLVTQHIAVPVAAMNALVLKIKASKASTWMELEKELYYAIESLKSCNEDDLGGKTNISLGSGCELFMKYVTKAFNLEFKEFAECKEELLRRGERFAGMSMSSRNQIAETGQSFIQDGFTVLIHGHSRVVTALILKAFETKNFSIVLTEGRPNGFSLETAKLFADAGIPTKIICDTAAGVLMESVDMCLVGAEGVMENGGIVNKVGTYQIALLAKAVQKPFYVAVESYKFARMYPLSQRDALGMAITGENDANSFQESKIANLFNCTEVPDNVTFDFPSVDFTPAKLITLLFTDLGVLTPAAVSDELIRLYQ